MFLFSFEKGKLPKCKLPNSPIWESSLAAQGARPSSQRASSNWTLRRTAWGGAGQNRWLMQGREGRLVVVSPYVVLAASSAAFFGATFVPGAVGHWSG